MILTDLFEAAESPAVEAKRLMREWRDSAATQKYELTIDSSGTNASNAFPVVRKAGTWFGGVFIPRGGDKKEVDRLLGVNHRAKAWIKSVLAPSLEKMIEDGREVRISSKSTGNLNSKFYEGVPVVKAGDVAAQLQKHTVEDSYMMTDTKRVRVYWWVSTSAESANITTVNFHISFGDEMTKPAKTASLLISMHKDEARAFASRIVDLKNKNTAKSMQLARELVDTFFPEAKIKHDTWAQIHVALGAASGYFTRVDADKVKEIVGKYV